MQVKQKLCILDTLEKQSARLPSPVGELILWHIKNKYRIQTDTEYRYRINKHKIIINIKLTIVYIISYKFI